jgi:tetratricopeptide (TPR) repeat protein
MTGRARPLVTRLTVAAALALCVPSPWAHPGIDEQIADVTRRIEATPGDATLFMRRGELHRIHRDWNAAAADYARARALDPKLAAVDLCEGSMLLDAGRHREAKKMMDRFLARVPEHSTGHGVRARALARLGRHLEAAADFTRAIELARDDRPGPDYYLERARALAAAGAPHLPEAIRGLDEGIQRLGRPVTLELLAIELELELERWDSALARVDRIAEHAARKETWLVRKGEILERASRPALAREAYSATLAAIETLPPSRRRNRAVERLEQQAREALERLR